MTNPLKGGQYASKSPPVKLIRCREIRYLLIAVSKYRGHHSPRGGIE
jgi:hypothetical protein